MKTFDGYKKQALTDVYALLAGGGHKPLSEFSMAHTHPYLPLNGGTVTGNIILKGGTSPDMTYAGNVHPYIRFDNSDSSLNISLLFTDYDSYRRPAGIKLVGNQGNEWFEASNIYATTFYGALSGNASSATKLQTARTIWGLSFNGTANVNGSISGTYFHIEDRASNPYFLFIDSSNQIGYLQLLPQNKGVAIGSTESKSLIVNPSGNVGIGTSNPLYKLDINGDIWCRGALKVGSSTSNNYIAFYGNTGDAPGSFVTSFIGEHLWGGDESTELLLMKFNDAGNGISGTTVSNSGPDRIRHIAHAHVFLIMTNTSLGDFATMAATTAVETKLDITRSRITASVPLYLQSDLYVNGTLGVNNIATFNINNQWLTPSKIQIGRTDDSRDASKAVIGVTNGNLHIDAYHGYSIYLNFYNKGRVKFGYQTGTYYISEDGSYYSGNASTATKLTSSAGSATLPIYFSDGKPVACTASSVFSNLSNSGNNISMTVAGQNRTLTVGYASNADTVDGYHARNVYNAPSFLVHNSYTSNTYVLLATITISGTSLACAEFTTLFQNRECLDNSSFILSGAIRRNSTTSVYATLSYITLHTETPRNIYMRSDDGVTFRVYIQSAANSWTTYYKAIPIVDSGNITYSNTGTTSPISGSVLNITATKGGNVNYANSANNADTLDNYHANGLLTALSNSNNGISITVGGTTKSISNISVNYANSAGNADTLDGLHANAFATAGHNHFDRLSGVNIDTGLSHTLNRHYEINNATGTLPFSSNWHQVYVMGGGDSGYTTQICTGLNVNTSLYFRHRINTTWNSWRTILDSANYNDYAPTKTGGGASGTWRINISGNASTSAVLLTNNTSQAADACYNESPGLRFWRYNGTSSTTGQGGGDGWILSWSWNSGSVGGQIYLDDNPTKTMCIRGRNNDANKTFTTWATILHSDNYTSYCATKSHTHSYLPLSGGTLTGSLRISGDWENDFGIHLDEGGSSVYGADIVYGAGDTLKIGTRNNSTSITAALTIARGSTTVDFKATPTVNGTAVSLKGHTHNYLPLSGGSLSGTLRIDCPTSQANNYNEGIRCNLGGTNNWASVVLGGANGSTSGSGNGIYSLLVNSNLFRIRQNSTDVISVNTSNNVGIGTNSPSYKLHTVGDIYSSTYIRATSGFVKGGSSNSYVLLGGGSHKALSDFSMAHSHPYLPLSGGTMIGLIVGNNKGGSWILGRSNAALYQPRTTTDDWHPVVGFKTKTGSWEFGNVGNDDFATFSWESDSNYNSGANTNTRVNLRNISGTIALTSDIPTKSSWNYDDRYSKLGHTHDDRYYTESEINSKLGAYLPLSGGTMTGALNFKNGTWNLMGDDAYIGDCNVGGMIGVKGANAATPGFVLYNNSGTLLGKLYASGGTLIWSGDTIQATTFNGNATTASNADKLDGYHASSFATSSHTHSYITIPTCSSLNGNSNNFSVEYAGGSNSVATKPSGVDAFGVMRLRTAGGWYGQILMSANTAPGIYYRNANGLTSSIGWIKLLDSSNSSVLGGGSAWGSSITVNINGISKTLTIPNNPNTDYRVTQSETTTTNYRPLVLGYINVSTAGSGMTGSVTNQVYLSNKFYVQPSTGNLYATTFVGALFGNAMTASKWATARTLTLTGSVTGSVSIDGSKNVTLTTTTNHTHNWTNIEGKPTTFTPSFHTHDDRYYTESEINNLLSNKLNISNFNWTNLSGKLVAGNEFNIVNDGFNSSMWFNHSPINDRSKTASINGYHFGNGAGGYTSIQASGFIKNGSSSSYVLLGDGGHKAESSLSVSYASSAGNADKLDGKHASAFALSSHTHSYLPLAGGTMSADARISYNSDGDLYIGNSSNDGWVYVQDMASLNGATYWNITQAGSATFNGTVTAPTFSGNATTATMASKLGSSTVGSNTRHFYLNAGTATASTATVGGTAKPMYLKSGVMTAISVTVGSASKPVYLSGGTITACSSSLTDYLPLTGGRLSGDLYIDNAKTPSIWARYTGNTAIRICASSSATHIQIGNSAWNANVPLYISGPNTNLGSTLYLKFSTVNASGNILASHFYENSDIRYKKILKNLSINSNIIANLPLFDFEWIENNAIGTGTSALAVQQILPNLVSGTDKLTLDYGVLGTIAGITACKELVTLKSELLQLKEKVKLLEDKLRKYENI